MKTYIAIPLIHCFAAFAILFAARNAGAQTYGNIAPYANDAGTVLLDHFNSSTSASILAYTNNGGSCGLEMPSMPPSYSYGSGPGGLAQALTLQPPTGDSTTSRSYLKYPGGELLTQANGTLECWVCLTNYSFGIHQLTYIGECSGDVGGITVSSTGQLVCDLFYTTSAAIHFDSGANIIPLKTWTHVALSWGSTGAKLYINGTLVGSNSNTGSFAHWPFGSNSVFGFIDSGNYIDELRISNFQRTNFNLPCTTCPPAVDLKMFAGLIINGPIGSNYNVQATSALGTPNWITLTNVTLQTQPYVYIDYRSPTNDQQFYRVVSP